MNSTSRVVIVGGGIAGLSTAYFLARRGDVRVTLLEREESLGLHSTGKNAAILRTWTPDPELTRFAVESARFLSDPPPGFSDVPLVEPRGLLLVTAHDEAAVRAVYDAAGVEAPPLEPVSRERFGELAPHFGAVPEDAHLLHFPSEGNLDVAAITAGFASGARAAGAELRTGCAVRELVVEEGARRPDPAHMNPDDAARPGAVRGVLLESGERLDADVVVLAAGGWAARLAHGTASRVRLEPTRRHLCVTAVDASVDPRWPTVWSDLLGFYTRPESGGLLLCACDQTAVDPDRCDVDPAVLDAIAAKTATSLPRYANAEAAHLWAGLRTHAAGGRFLIGPDEHVPGLAWVAGLGGHGMTASAAVGMRAAERIARD